MNKLDVLARINPQMKAILAKEATLAGDANDTSVGFDVMRENYVLGREFWVEGGPVMKLLLRRRACWPPRSARSSLLLSDR